MLPDAGALDAVQHAADADWFATLLAGLHDDGDVTFDRPFLYFIVDQPTGQILFVGRVLDPSAGAT